MEVRGRMVSLRVEVEEVLEMEEEVLVDLEVPVIIAISRDIWLGIASKVREAKPNMVLVSLSMCLNMCLSPSMYPNMSKVSTQ